MRIKSKTSLDLLNLSVAGLRDGVGPLLTVFLIANTNWTPLELSWVLAAPIVGNLIGQFPSGMMYEKVKDQRLLIGLAAVLLTVAAFGISLLPPLAVTILLQVMAGFACCLLSIGIPSVTLKAVPRRRFAVRLARSEMFNKIGNFTAIAITGFLAQKFSLYWMFATVFVLSMLVISSVLTLKKPLLSVAESVPVLPVSPVVPLLPGSGNNAVLAKAPNKFHDGFESVLGSMKEAFQKPEFAQMLFLCFLYQFANSAMYMVFEQSFVRGKVNGGAGVVSAAIFASQFILVLASTAIARKKDFDNPTSFLGIGFALIFLRGLVFSMNLGLVSLAVAQILDGFVGAILTIVPLRALAAHFKTKFNLMMGVLGTATMLGSTLSTIFAGAIMSKFGYVPAFLTFGTLGFIGVCVSAFLKLAELRARNMHGERQPVLIEFNRQR